MSNAVDPMLSEGPVSGEELQAWLALYCKFMAVLQEEPRDAPVTGHIAYSAQSPSEVFFSSSAQNIALGATIPDGGIPKQLCKTPVQLCRFSQIEETFPGFLKQIHEADPSVRIYNSGSQTSLVGKGGQLFGHCAETIPWLVLSR